MGCLHSAQEVTVSTTRRRLSVGEVNNEASGANDNPDAEENRGLITQLAQDDVLKLIQASKGATGDRKFSIGSETDTGKTSFANKTIKELGDGADNSGLGYTCRKGLKPESPNQDSWSVLKLDGDFSIYGVYDGHGQKGHDVSNFVKDAMPKLILKDERFKTADMGSMLTDVFKKTQGLIRTLDQTGKVKAQMSGTTATIVIHDHVAAKLTVGHVADSTCVLGSWTDASKTNVTGKPLTRDHKPDLKDERQRIEKAGGRVVFDGYANHRVYAKNAHYPGLNMSRCLGDLLGHAEAGCSCEPEVNTFELTPMNNLLLVCSDGVWEFISAEEAVQIVAELPAAQATKAAEKLAKEAWDRWMKEEGEQVVDDITVILVHLPPPNRGQ